MRIKRFMNRRDLNEMYNYDNIDKKYWIFPWLTLARIEIVKRTISFCTGSLLYVWLHIAQWGQMQGWQRMQRCELLRWPWSPVSTIHQQTQQDYMQWGVRLLHGGEYIYHHLFYLQIYIYVCAIHYFLNIHVELTRNISVVIFFLQLLNVIVEIFKYGKIKRAWVIEKNGIPTRSTMEIKLSCIRLSSVGKSW